MSAPALAGYTCDEFTFDGVTHSVYRAGEGPAVIVMAEIPGITPKVLEFAERVKGLGCSVWIPWLFGTPGREPSAPYLVTSFAPACVSKEFAAFARNDTAPIIRWLRSLAAEAHQQCGGPGVGAVGMCLTGGFALGMMVEPAVIAPVLSQPSLPLPLGGARKRSIHLSPEDLGKVKARAADGVCVLGLRFTGDPAVPQERFATLRAELGDNFIGVEIDSSPGNPHGNPRAAHSVLTEHLVDVPGHPTSDALDQVLTFFRSRLLPA